jgi:hypothetical protein
LPGDSGEAVVEELLDLAVAVLLVRGGELLVEESLCLVALGATGGGVQGGGQCVAASKPFCVATGSAEGIGHDGGRSHEMRD